MLPSSSCQLTTFFIGVSEICFMSAPVGPCDYCCPHDDMQDIQYKLFTRYNYDAYTYPSECDRLHTPVAGAGRARARARPAPDPHPRPVCGGPKERYVLYYGSNPTTFDLISVGDRRSLQRSRFNASNPTVIYLMGFTEATTGRSTTTMRDTYLSAEDCNFVAVDWARLVAFPWYVTAVRNTRYMGDRLADFVQYLERVGVRAATLHVIGFSLGAEAAGFGGKELRRRGLLLGRITGLDPAYPGYGLTTSDGHLAKGDAAFVDVLHTNPGVFGFPLPIGDVDFYPNAGQWVQPGCWVDQLIRNREVGFMYGCSHNRAWRLYAESVLNPSGFPATLCRQWKGPRRVCSFRVAGYMGFGAQPPLSGKMYLETNQNPPFARNGP